MKRGLYNMIKEKLGLEDFEYEELLSIVKGKGIDAFKKVYGEYFLLSKKNKSCEHNLYSMTLFSGLADPFRKIIVHCLHHEKFVRRCGIIDDSNSF